MLTAEVAVSMTGIALRLRGLNATLQQLANFPNIEDHDRLLLEEAQHACNVGTDLANTNRAIQAKYACFYAEACVALIQSDMQSAERLRRLLREDLVSGSDADASIAS
jgi:hypothetical protein